MCPDNNRLAADRDAGPECIEGCRVACDEPGVLRPDTVRTSKDQRGSESSASEQITRPEDCRIPVDVAAAKNNARVGSDEGSLFRPSCPAAVEQVDTAICSDDYGVPTDGYAPAETITVQLLARV